VDTDGDCFDLIPLFLEGGATGMYPMEASCGMDIVKVRKAFPRLRMMGGVPKAEIIRGASRIDQILEPVAAVLKTGGYIPFGDHFIPPDVSWANFRYYREKLNALTAKGTAYETRTVSQRRGGPHLAPAPTARGDNPGSSVP